MGGKVAALRPRMSSAHTSTVAAFHMAGHTMLPPHAMTPRATVLIPTHDHGATLLYSTRSALAQTVREIEVFIVGDGMSPDTTLAADELERADTRVRVFRHPKGPRHGEIYRHSALAEASGAIVCYLSDDDLWLPNHVEVMEELLRAADFAHTLGIRVSRTAACGWGTKWISACQAFATLVFTPGLRVGGTSLSAMAHTLAMYRRLPVGWDTTPRRHTHGSRHVPQVHPAIRVSSCERHDADPRPLPVAFASGLVP